MGPIIREIAYDEEIGPSVEVIRESFGTVARQFGLTRENCPAHPSFVTTQQLRGLCARGQRFFGLFADGVQVGFVAVEKVGEAEHTMEKLAVVPAARHRGYGARLARFALDLAAGRGATTVSIGVIDEHTVLKDWYKSLGFAETGTQKFSHLPFTVCFMKADIKGNQREV